MKVARVVLDVILAFTFGTNSWNFLFLWPSFATLTPLSFFVEIVLFIALTSKAYILLVASICTFRGFEASSLHFMGVAIFFLFSHKSPQYWTFFSFDQWWVQQKEAYFTCFFLQTLNTFHYKPKDPNKHVHIMFILPYFNSKLLAFLIPFPLLLEMIYHVLPYWNHFLAIEDYTLKKKKLQQNPNPLNLFVRRKILPLLPLAWDVGISLPIIVFWFIDVLNGLYLEAWTCFFYNKIGRKIVIARQGALRFKSHGGAKTSITLSSLC